jgi:hypothetical protein
MRDALAQWGRPAAPSAPPLGWATAPVEAVATERFLELAAGPLAVRLNRRRGLAVHTVSFDGPGGATLCGTLPQGYFDDVDLGPDWYTGHVVVEEPGVPKVTDLERVEPEVERHRDGRVRAAATVATRFGPLSKAIELDPLERVVRIHYELRWNEVPFGSFRLGHITLYPEAFDRATLAYVTRNGGEADETFPLAGQRVDHGAPVSFLVSASGGVDMTGGWLEFRDARRALRIEVDSAQLAVIGLVRYVEVGERFLCRLALSAGELDDTRRRGTPLNEPLRLSVTLRSPQRTDVEDSHVR